MGGEKLDTSGVVLVPTAAETTVEARFTGGDDGYLEGMLFINARDYDDAIAIARSTPHVRYGGRVAVRRVEPT